jgi:hypothetical protein
MTELYEGRPGLGDPNRITPEIEETLEELFSRSGKSSGVILERMIQFSLTLIRISPFPCGKRR